MGRKRTLTAGLSAKMNAWFLGPKSENGDLLESFIIDVLRDHIYWRRNFHPEDRVIISERDKRAPQYDQVISDLKDRLTELTASLKRDVPFNSPRYLAHMTSDPVIPATIGYIAALLYNPNNLSREVAPSTQRMEMQVAEDLASLTGFNPATSWGHLTSGGTIANLEALWVARNLKLLPLALKHWAESGSVLTPTKRQRILSDLGLAKDEEQLFGMPPDKALGLIHTFPRMLKRHIQTNDNPDPSELDRIIWTQITEWRRLLGKLYIHPGMVVLAPKTRHYSIDKSLDILGLGSHALRAIDVDDRFRMNGKALHATLEECRKKHEIVVSVVAVVGSTEEGSIDPVDAILNERSQMEQMHGMSFFVHVDAAYGGYARTLLDDGTGQPGAQSCGDIRTFLHCKVLLGGSPREISWPEPEIYGSLRAMERADAVVIDPHKCGYIPYPAGAVIFKNKSSRQLLRQDPAYFSYEPADLLPQWMAEEGKDTPLGSTILEGSKPGAAAAACWLANRTIGLNQKGYGAILGETIRGAQELYHRLSVVGKDEPFDIRPLTRPDFNIVCFVVKERGNEELRDMNSLTNYVYSKFPAYSSGPLPSEKFFLSKTHLWHANYGASLVKLLANAGLSTESQALYSQNKLPIVVLRVPLMNPWLSSASRGEKYLQDFVEILKSEVRDALRNADKGRAERAASRNKERSDG